jgi:hypothetical protein
MHRSCTGSSTAVSGGPIVSLESRVKVITKPRRTACFSRRNKGPSGSGMAPRGRDETQAQSEPKGEGGRRKRTRSRRPQRRRGASKGAQADDGVARVGRAVEVQRKGRPERKFERPRHWMEVRRIGQADCRASGVERGRASRGCWTLRPLPGLARGKRPDAANRRPPSSRGSGRGAPKRLSSQPSFRVNHLIRPCEIGFGPIFCV